MDSVDSPLAKVTIFEKHVHKEEKSKDLVEVKVDLEELVKQMKEFNLKLDSQAFEQRKMQDDVASLVILCKDVSDQMNRLITALYTMHKAE